MGVFMVFYLVWMVIVMRRMRVSRVNGVFVIFR